MRRYQSEAVTWGCFFSLSSINELVKLAEGIVATDT